ncbi:unnamed protein product [Triticum turgidum subsp. durum]|uniref:Wall-associated receptor kinase galacturonan-binding domain-containing protein n=1 Tax=Triticum turgidum subsp. durum TaxID=4567 RepID=A0A9R0SKD9_TRITD|nr:unnamed protein product [Triticum turgidum subsp. durum]
MLTSRCVFITAVLQLLISFPAVAGEPRIGLPGCQTSCGNVSVLYPFGMGPKRCYWPGLKLTCDDRGSKPPRLLFGDGGAGAFEVVEISLEKLTMRVVSHKLQAININMSSGGSGRLSLGYTEAIGGAPYFLQQGGNEMILTGCNVQATLRCNGNIVNRCASFCPIFTDDNGSPLPAQYFAADYNSNSCSNLGCCQSSILSSSTSYDVEVNRLGDCLRYGPVPDPFPDDVPMNVLIAEEGWFYPENVINVPSWPTVIFRWAVPHGAAIPVGPCPDEAARSICKSTHSYCTQEWSNIQSGTILASATPGYTGNPYLTYGCQDIHVCDQKEKHGCFGHCERLPGYVSCRCPEGTNGNYSIPGGCVADTNTGMTRTSQSITTTSTCKQWNYYFIGPA